MIAVIPYKRKCKACGHVYIDFLSSGGGVVCKPLEPNDRVKQSECPKCGSTKSEVAGLWDQIKGMI